MRNEISWKNRVFKILGWIFGIVVGIFIIGCVGLAVRGWCRDIIPKKPHYVWGPVADKYTEVRKSTSVFHGIPVSSNRYTYYLTLDVADDSEQNGEDDRGDGSDVMKFQVSKSLYKDVKIGDFVILDDANETMDYVAAEDWADYTRTEMDELVCEKYGIE